MKKRIITVAVLGLLAIVIIIAIVSKSSHLCRTDDILSDKYNDKEYIAEINSVELSPELEAVISEDDLFMVKMAILENDINPKNEEKLVPLIEKYGVGSVLISYSFLNDKFVTWKDLEKFIKSIKSHGTKEAIKAFDANAVIYIPTEFKMSQLVDWIDNKGYRAEDIGALDKLSQICGKDFYDLLTEYENGKTISEIKADLGLVNTKSEPNRIAISQIDVNILAEKLGVDETHAKNVLVDLVRLNVDISKLDNIDNISEYDLLASILEERYGGTI